MSLTHCAASRSGSRRLPVLRIPLMVGLSVALTVPALTACQEEGEVSTSSSSSASSASPHASEAPSDSSSAESTEVNGGAAGWSLLVSAPGWTNTKHDTGGVNELVSDEGCQFVTTQNLFEGQPSSDREETDIQAQNEIQKFSQGVTNVSFKPAQDDATSVKDSSGNPIETKRLDWTYTGKDGKDYQATEYLRAFTTIKKPTFLIATLICPSDKYSTADLDDLMKYTTVTDPGPADMDEGDSGSASGSGKGEKDNDKKSGTDGDKATAPSDKNDGKGSDRSSNRT